MSKTAVKRMRMRNCFSINRGYYQLKQGDLPGGMAGTKTASRDRRFRRARRDVDELREGCQRDHIPLEENCILIHSWRSP